MDNCEHHWYWWCTIFQQKFEPCEDSWLFLQVPLLPSCACGLVYVSACACVTVCSCNQRLLLESCALHRFFVLLWEQVVCHFGWLILVSFILLHGGAIKAEGGKITRCSFGAPGKPPSPLNFSAGCTMTVLLLVADGGAAERISRRGREIFVGSEANMFCAALVINMHKMLLSSESLAAHDECVFFFSPSPSLMSIFQIFHWASPLSDACVCWISGG